MGGGQSQSQENVREVTVEKGPSEDGAPPSVIVTEDFVNYLRSKVDPGGSENHGRGRRGLTEDREDSGEGDLSTEAIIAEDDQYEDDEDGSRKWRRKYEMEREKNAQLKNLTSEEFDKMVAEVRGKFSNQIPELVPVCEDSRNKVTDCYRSNPCRPLNCSLEVCEYMQCVQKMREEVSRRSDSNNNEENSATKETVPSQ